MPTTRRDALRAGVAGLGGLAVLGGCVGVPVRENRTGCPPGTTGEADAHLGFVGDVMLGREVDAHWGDGPPAGVWDGMRDRLRGLDGVFANLECCLSDQGEPRDGRTYHFRADPDWAVPALSAADVSWVSLANNHVLDFGQGAFADTLDHLDRAGIAHAGAGPDAAAARAPSLVTAGGLRVGVVAFTDRSPSYGAAADRPGTAFAPLDRSSPPSRRIVGDALDRVFERDPDLVVASLHWGPNWEVRPSDTQRSFARWLIDQGVDLVHGHSAHVLQGVETYRGRPILYDCGDFVDDYLFREDLHNKRSALFELRVREGRPAELYLYPVQIYDESVHPAGDEEAAWVRDRMATLSGEMGTDVRCRGRELAIPIPECESEA